MSTDRLFERIRAANPSPAVTLTDDALFAQIVAQPGDPRVAMRPRRPRVRRWVPLLAAGIVLLGGGGAVGAISLGAFDHASPKALFEANPAGPTWRPGIGNIWPSVIPGTVRRATTVIVPGFGQFELWIALSRPKGWLCTAIRQPDGTWADLGTQDKYQLGGPEPGCGTLGWQDARGFDYWPSTIRSPDGMPWWFEWGYAPTSGHPVEVRDAVSGTSVPLGDGRYFAIVIPQTRPGFRLQTLDAFGRVLVTDRFDTGR